MNLLKEKEEKIRKFKSSQYEKEIKEFNRNLQSEVIISDENIDEEIPSFFLSSTLNSSLRENKTRPVSYIVHSKDRS